MRSLTKLLVLLAMLIAPASILLAQGTEPAAGAPAAATKAEVDQLRSEVAAQRQTIEELKTLVEKLAAQQTTASVSSDAKIRPVSNTVPEAAGLPVDDRADGVPHLMNAVLVEAEPEPAAINQAAPAKKEAPLSAGWNGEHFFIRSADGQFSISPYGYVDT